VIAHLQGEIDEDESCSSLPGSCLFVLLFCISCFLAEQTSMTFAIRSLLHEVTNEDAHFAFINGTEEQQRLGLDEEVGMKVLGNVNTRQDIHSWLRLGLLPIFKESFGSGDPVQWGYNAAVGGIRVSQQVADGQQCHDGEFAVRFFGSGLCYPAQFPGGGYLQPPLPEVLATSGGDADSAMWVLFEDGWEAGLNQVDEFLRPEGTWLGSGQPEAVTATVPLYNPELNILTLVYAEFFLPRSGKQWTRVVAPAILLQLYRSIWHIIADVLLCAQVAWIAAKEIWGTLLDWRGNASRDDGESLVVIMWTRYQRAESLSSAVVTVSFLLLCAIWGNFCWMTQQLVETMESPVFGSRLLMGTEQEKVLGLLVLMERAEGIVRYALVVRAARALFLLVAPIKVFLAFSAQPRLSLLTETLRTCLTDVLHFLVIFSVIFTTYATIGLVLFGGSVDHFADIERAFNSCYRIVLGDMLWEDLRRKAGPLPATVWVISFCFINAFVLLNMLLAVVLDCYMEVKGRVGSACETLPEQAQETLRRWWRNKKGQRMTVSQILEQLKRHEVGPEAKIGIRQFRNMVPGLGAPQAFRLLSGAVGLWEDTEGQSRSLSQSIILISAIDTYVRNINRSIGLLLTVKGTAWTNYNRTATDTSKPHSAPTSPILRAPASPALRPPAEDALLALVRRHRAEQRQDFGRVLSRLEQIEAAPSGAETSSYDSKRPRQADFRRGQGRKLSASGAAPTVICTEGCGLLVPACSNLAGGNGDALVLRPVTYARARQRALAQQIIG